MKTKLSSGLKAIAILLLAGSSFAEPGDIVLVASDDAYVSQAHPSTNYGSATRLFATRGIETQSSEKIYLQFNASGLPPITDIVDFQAVYTNTYARAGWTFLLLGPNATNWTEQTITYENAPANNPLHFGFLPEESLRLGYLSDVPEGQTATFVWSPPENQALLKGAVLTALNSGDRTLTLAIERSSTNRNLSYASKEHPSYHGPRLILSTLAVNEPMTDQSFFQKLDLDRPGLEAVRAAVQTGDYSAARSALAAYYRGRTGVFHYVDGQDPTRHIANPGARLQSARPLVERTGSWDKQYWDGNFFDWIRAPVHNKDRMYFFETFGEAAAVEEGNDVAAALVNLMRSFVHLYHSPGTRGGGMWATMNVGIRMRTGWPVAFLCLLQSPAFTDDDLVLFLKSVWDQSNYLWRFPSETSNWLTFEMAGLHTSGVVYPEFKDSVEWRRLASETALEDIDRGWLPDGMTIELSPGYGRYFSNYFVMHDLAAHVGRLHEFGLDAFPAKTEALFESYLKIMAPDRFAPATNNNGPVNVMEILSGALPRFPDREEFRWVVTHGQQGSPPDFLSTVLPYAGFAAMRSGWEREAHMLYFDFGQVGYRHAHQDGLNMMLWAYGRQILFDPGLTNYDHSLPMVNYAMDTFSHNTVLVDNRPQRRRWYNNPHPNRMPYQELTDFRWRTNERFDAVAGVYDEAYGLQGASNAYPYSAGSNFLHGWVYPSTHSRRAFFLKPDIFLVADTLASKDGNPHDYDLRWHLSPVQWQFGADGMRLATKDAGLPNLEIAPLFPDGLEVRATSAQMTPEILGWNAGNPLNPRAATTVQHLKSGPGKVQFFTLLLPLARGRSSLVDQIDPIDASTALVRLNDGRNILAHAPPDPRFDLAAMFYETGEGIFEDDFESHAPGFAPTRPDDSSPHFWIFTFGGASENREVSVIPTEDANGAPTQALRLFQGKPLADSRDGLSFARGFGPVLDEEIELSFRFRLNANLYSPGSQEIGGTYYQIYLRDAEGRTAVRLQITLDGADGLRDRVTPLNPKPGFTLQQGMNAETDRVNLIPTIVPGDWYEITIRTFPPDQTFYIQIINTNSDEPQQRDSLTDVPYAEQTTGIADFSGGRAWTWSILDAHMDDVSIRPAGAGAGAGGFDAWRAARFTETHLGDDSISGPHAAPAGDRLPNLLKYALGLDPWTPGAHLLPRPTIPGAGDQAYLTLSFTRPGATDDVSVIVEASGEVAGPFVPAVRIGGEERPDGLAEFTYRDVEPIGSRSRRFLRVRVEQK